MRETQQWLRPLAAALSIEAIALAVTNEIAVCELAIQRLYLARLTASSFPSFSLFSELALKL